MAPAITTKATTKRFSPVKMLLKREDSLTPKANTPKRKCKELSINRWVMEKRIFLVHTCYDKCDTKSEKIHVAREEIHVNWSVLCEY